MKALIYGKKPITDLVSENLGRAGIATAAVYENNDISFSYGDKPDMLIIDAAAEGALEARDFIHRFWNICTVLIFQHGRESWQDMDRFAADGYLTDHFNNTELPARLIAVLRRYVRENGNDTQIIDELAGLYSRIKAA